MANTLKLLRNGAVGFIVWLGPDVLFSGKLTKNGEMIAGTQ